MRVNKFELTLANHIQDKSGMSLEEFETRYGKSISSLKRYLSNINDYCQPDKQFIIEGEQIINRMNYTDLIEMIQSLSILDYFPSQHERFLLIVVFSFFNPYINLSQLYDQIGMSMTTKKKDSKDLDSYLSSKGLKKETVPKKGITIKGSENKYRILIAHIIGRFCELDINDNFISRRANNPLEQMIFSYFHQIVYKQEEKALQLLNQFLEINHCKLSYPSKKLLLIYLNIALYRINQGFLVEEIRNIPIQVESHDLFGNYYEDLFLNYLIASFDFTVPIKNGIIDSSFQQSVRQFVDTTLDHMITQIYTYNELLSEVYAYLKKSVITLQLREDFYDNKLDQTHQQVNRMYTILLETVPIAEKSMKVTFSQSQVAGLTLIFRKYVMKNREVGRNRKRIVIVTNSAIEKTNFFFELLRQSVDIELAGIININELHLLSSFKYDQVLVFSNRIKMLLKQIDIPCIRLNFYIMPTDIEMLIEQGFSTSARKINTIDFIDNIYGKSKDDIKKYILKHYPEMFISY